MTWAKLFNTDLGQAVVMVDVTGDEGPELIVYARATDSELYGLNSISVAFETEEAAIEAFNDIDGKIETVAAPLFDPSEFGFGN